MVAAPKMFASMFTLSVALLFGYCLTTICYMAYDPDARFFIGRWPLWGLLWVPLFGVAHWWHMRRGSPSRSVMMACVFGPATTYFIIGWVILHRATRLHTVLRSSDCSRTEEFKEFNKAALAARAFHNKCLAESSEQLLIHFCPGYEDTKAMDNNAETWEYLKYAEHNYGCAGFCNVAGDPSMWTYQGYQDSCAKATANVMKSKVAALAFQMMVYSIMVVVLFLLWIEIMGPTLKAIERDMPLPEKKEEPRMPMPAPSTQRSYRQSYPVQQSIQQTLPPVGPPMNYPPPPSMGPEMSMPPPMESKMLSMPPPSMPPRSTSMGPQATVYESLPPAKPPSMPPAASMAPKPPSMPPAAFTSSRLDQ